MFSLDTKVFLYGKHLAVAQRMIDFDYLCGKSAPSLVGIVSEGQTWSVKLFRWDKERLFPLFSSIDETEATWASVMINFASFRSAFQTTRDAMSKPWIDTIAIVAEWIPERDTRKLWAHKLELAASWKHLQLIWPSTVWWIVAGTLRIGHSWWSLDNIIASKLYRPGSVWLLSKSGGMMNELCRVIAQTTDGVHTWISFGGDRFPLLDIKQCLLDFEHNDDISMIVMLDEVGNTDPLIVCDLIKNKQITKPVVMWVSWSFAEHTPQAIQFGHAWAMAQQPNEKTQEKLILLRNAGVHVPDSYTDFGQLIGAVWSSNHSTWSLNDTLPDAVTTRLVIIQTRRATRITSSISDERGDELSYNHTPISAFVAHWSLGKVIGQLRLKKDLPDYACQFLDTILILLADHGPSVSGANNTIVAARADKDLVSSLASWLLTIWPRFGGSINWAAHWLFEGVKSTTSAQDIVTIHKQSWSLIPGIWHKIKTQYNPDKRCEILATIAQNFSFTPHYTLAKEVEALTLEKKSNLILNVDGAIAALLLDMMLACDFTQEEIEQYLTSDLFNGFFVLARSVGLIGHYLDQKRLWEWLYRTDENDILYL